MTHIPFQKRVANWMEQCFTPQIIADTLERADRFIEESLELIQATGYSAERAHALVDYTFNRPPGEPFQEVGGVLVTLAALCNPHNLNMTHAGEAELARVWTKIDVIRAKQATKPIGSALPMPHQYKETCDVCSGAGDDGQGTICGKCDGAGGFTNNLAFNPCEICEDPKLCAAGKTPCDLSGEFVGKNVPTEIANRLLLRDAGTWKWAAFDEVMSVINGLDIPEGQTADEMRRRIYGLIHDMRPEDVGQFEDDDSGKVT